MEFGPYNMLIDFCVVALLLVVGQLLRAKIGFFQKFFIPASIIAGTLALIFGPQGMNALPFSGSIGSYGYLLVCVLFATLFLGRTKFEPLKKIVAKTGDTFFASMIAEIGQFGVALLFGVLVLWQLFPEINKAFAIMLPAGWAGGYGYATAIGGSLEKYNFTDATTVGLAMATFGMLVGNFVGIIMINIGTRLKVTRFTKSVAELPESIKTGLIPENERKPIGIGTISPNSLDPLAWHLGLVLIATGMGYYANLYFKVLWPTIDVPMMCLTMLAGVLIQVILNTVKLGDYVDKAVMDRIGSLCTDFLIVFGIASIRTAIVVQYAMPLFLLCVLGLAICSFYLWWIGPRIFHDNWFERGIFLWGWACGNVACGVTLLRIIDPHFKSNTLQDYGLAYIPIAFIEVALVSLTPVFLGMGYVIQTTAVLLGATLVLVILAFMMGFIHRPLGKPVQESSSAQSL